MAGFIRRYRFSPGTELITQIEGVVIVDLPPPGSINGVGTGTACIVGEFADMTYACSVSSSGVVTSNPTPVEIFSSQDMVDKLGGFDELLGQFGVSMGNGFVEIRNKKFARLIAVPVDLITTGGSNNNGAIRVWRDLPTNASTTDPSPIVPVSPASVSAGREFFISTNKARLAQKVFFTDAVAYKSAIDGAVTGAGAAVFQSFTSATGNFVNLGVKKGDVLVLGVIGGGAAQNAGTYRVRSVTSATALSVEKMDGSSFTWTTGSALPYRLHVGATADSGPLNQLDEPAGYQVLARPTGAASFTLGNLLAPTITPPAGTATTWDSLSGLSAAIQPTGGTTLTYNALLHAANPAVNSTIEARYQAAIDATLSDDYPARDINIMTTARKSATLRSKLLSHVGSAAERGLTRRAIISPDLGVVTLSAVLADADPGVGGSRSDRIDYSWPGVQTSIPEAVGYNIATANSKTTSDGLLDVTADTWLMAVESSLPPERNPGQAAEPVPTVLAPVVSFQRSATAIRLGLPEYQQLRSRGVCAIRFDRVVGPLFQSGVTTSLTSGEKNIFRRRMADFIQDSLADRLNQLSKLPLTESLKNSAVGEVAAFLTELLSPNNPSAQRIDGFEVDDVSGNTPSTLAKGIFVIIVRVRLTPTADFIVLQTEIGEGVTITSQT